jgi:transposase
VEVAEVGFDGVRICGRVFCAEEIELVIELARSLRGESRAKLAATVCERLGWRRASGRLKTRECRDLLEDLEGRGRLELAALRAGRARGRPTGVPHTAAGEAGERIEGELRELGAVWLEVVEAAGEHALWRELIGRYHPLGYATAFGAQLRYLIHSRREGEEVVLGGLGYSSAAWRLRCRDLWIGWPEDARRKHLGRVVQQSRFLLLPWVKVPHLASHVLGLSLRRLAADWARRFGQPPLLVETLVDEHRYRGTCYRAANWQDLGLTAGRGRMDRHHRRHGAEPKRVFVYPLTPHVTARLQYPEAGRGDLQPQPEIGTQSSSERPKAECQHRTRGQALVVLTPAEAEELGRRVRAATSTQRDAIRARIVLGCAAGERAPEVARRLGISVRRVERWRARFVRSRLEGLDDRPRPGHKPRFDPLTRLELIALACEPLTTPSGTSRRSIQELCELAVERKIAESISWSSMQRILTQGDIRPQPRARLGAQSRPRVPSQGRRDHGPLSPSPS